MKLSTLLSLPKSEKAMVEVAVMRRRLKEAEPTIVFAPSSPVKYSLLINSIIDSNISGVLLPNAINVRFAIVSFHTWRSRGGGGRR